MRLRNFHLFIKTNFKTNEVVLNNTSLVIDGHSLLHRMFLGPERSYFGCDCNTHLTYVKNHLKKLQMAHVKCYFIFKGGDLANNFNLLKPPRNEDQRKFIDDKYESFEPLLAREVFKEALNEMGLDYAICEYGSKRECVALAQRLNCAVLSFNIDFYFFGVPYVPYITLDFNQRDNILRGKLFKLDELMTKFQLDKKQVAIFITLFNEYLLSKEFQDNMLKKLKLPLSYARRYDAFLSFLSKTGTTSLEIISKYISDEENKIFQSELRRNIETGVQIEEPGGLATKYFIDIDSCAFTRRDNEWFAKGVLWKFIAVPYVNVYRHGIFKGSWSIEDLDADDSVLLSAPIVRYAFDLLTNFNSGDLKFIGRSKEIENDQRNLLKDDGIIRILPTIRKPDYGSSNVFENGWKDVKAYQLFEHFLKESVQMEMTALQKAPTECRLLIAALIYFAQRKGANVDNEVYAILLSYVMLGVVEDAIGRDGTLDEDQCKIARTVMDEYFNTTDEEATSILDRKLLHPLVEFQQCLRHFNFLNKLCGSPLASTVYSKTINATFVYRVLYDIKRKYNGLGNNFLEDKLQLATTILSFVQKLFNVYVNRH